eukprot:9388272-Pyramimonas_sp.AAC.1
MGHCCRLTPEQREKAFRHRVERLRREEAAPATKRRKAELDAIRLTLHKASAPASGRSSGGPARQPTVYSKEELATRRRLRGKRKAPICYQAVAFRKQSKRHRVSQPTFVPRVLAPVRRDGGGEGGGGGDAGGGGEAGGGGGGREQHVLNQFETCWGGSTEQNGRLRMRGKSGSQKFLGRLP